MAVHSTYARTIIVGAGLAGLGAASTLSAHEASGGESNTFLILEASASPGGRAKTIHVDAQALDLGAQWIHGSDNALYRLASRHGLVASETSQEGGGAFVRVGGRLVDARTVHEVGEEVGRILEECRKFHNHDDEAAPASLGTFLEDRFMERLHTTEHDEDSRTLKLELFGWHLRFQVIDNSCRDLRELSAKWWGSYVGSEDSKHYNLIGGYGSLIDVLMKNSKKSGILFNCLVRVINYSNSLITVECDLGTFTCDHIILTPSIGVLPQINFIPPIPTNPAIGFYGIGKIFLFFHQRWWKNFKGFQFLWDRNDIDHERGLQHGWVRDLTGFEEVFNHPQALMGWIGGKGLRRMEELDEAEVGSACVKTLRRFLDGLVEEVPEPKRVIRTRWLSDPLTRGSYCHVITASDSSDESPIVARSKPIVVRGVPRIFSAGEASHPTRYSTAHGAFESGISQAERLIEYLANEK